MIPLTSIMGRGRTLPPTGDAIRQLRVARGLSPERFVTLVRERYLADRGHRSTFSLSTLKRMESGRHVFIGSIEAAAGALGVPLMRIVAPEGRAELGGAGTEAAHPAHTTQAPPWGAGAIGPVTVVHVRLTCEERFRKILIQEYRAVQEGKMREERYWKSYWYHQLDQFRYWRDGLLDEETFRTWMRARRRDFVDDQRLRTTSFRTGWAGFRDWAKEGDFSSFVEMVFAGSIDQAIVRFRRRVIKAGVQ